MSPMRNSQTAVLERNTTFDGTFATEPFETGWAREARWFFQVLDRTGAPRVELRTQVSPDGLNWVDLDDRPRSADDDLTSWAVQEFGHWLRVRGTVAGGAVKVRIYLALKG